MGCGAEMMPSKVYIYSSADPTVLVRGLQWGKDWQGQCQPSQAHQAKPEQVKIRKQNSGKVAMTYGNNLQSSEAVEAAVRATVQN